MVLSVDLAVGLDKVSVEQHVRGQVLAMEELVVNLCRQAHHRECGGNRCVLCRLQRLPYPCWSLTWREDAMASCEEAGAGRRVLAMAGV